MINERVQVFYTVDNRYAPYLAVSIKSLIEHTNPEREYDINVIHQDLNKENMERIENMKTENVAINL